MPTLVATKSPSKTAQTATGGGETDECGDDFGNGDAEENPQKTAQQSHGGGFDEELDHDVFSFGTQSLADADFAGALGDRDQHDVHDDHTADHQRNGGDADNNSRKHAGDLIEQADERIVREDGEVVLGADRVVTAGAHQGADFVDGLSSAPGAMPGFRGDVRLWCSPCVCR